jgi:hypothetical protein
MAGGYPHFKTKYLTSLILISLFQIYRAVMGFVNYNWKRRTRIILRRTVSFLFPCYVSVCKMSSIKSFELRFARKLIVRNYTSLNVTCLHMPVFTNTKVRPEWNQVNGEATVLNLSCHQETLFKQTVGGVQNWCQNVCNVSEWIYGLSNLDAFIPQQTPSLKPCNWT